MPLYEYSCQACGQRFELIQRFSDQPEANCPSCGQSCERLFSAPSFQFKGSGWYITDYAKKHSPSPSSSNSEPSKGESKNPSSPINNTTP